MTIRGAPDPERRQATCIYAPLRRRHFRNVWIGGLLSNFGTFAQLVGAAWAMTLMTRSEPLVALVQTASSLPIMLLAIFAGTIADLFDRRRVAIAALAFAFAAATLLTIVFFTGLLTPAILLVLCALVACGTTLFGPAWQSSVREHVPSAELPAAIALNSVSFNLGRSLGPAIGGLIVTAAGAGAAFAANALSFVPALVALYRLPPHVFRAEAPRERILRAAIAGIGYVVREPTIRVVLMRSAVLLFCMSALLALLPLLAQRQLSGDAFTYGVLFAMFGAGAVIGALSLSALNARLGRETIACILSGVLAMAMIGLGASHWLAGSAVAAAVAGTAGTALVGTFNIAVQLSAAPGLTGRALSAFHAVLGSGVAVGSWAWGAAAAHLGISTSMVAAGVALLASLLLGVVIPIPAHDRG